MLNRRETLKTMAAAGAALTLGSPLAEASAPLSWTVIRADETGFLRAPVLVSGAKQAVLIDAGFTYADGKAVAEAIAKTGKRLTAIYITVNDPDYYFSLPPIHAAFPGVPVLAAPETVALIRAKAEGKIKTWSPKLGDNGPKALGDLVLPTASTVKHLTVDGQRLEIITAPGLGDRGRYFWVPSLQAVFGGTMIAGGIYPWVADTPTVADRRAWIAALDQLIKRQPKIVVPGHMSADTPTDVSTAIFTRDFLIAFEAELAKAADSAALIAAMKARYPGLGGEFSLELGAKVAKGEMKWG